jgi:hypothetical protein
MIVTPGEKLHVITRPLFERDVRRHFVGEVVAANDLAARVQGYAFVFEPQHSRFARRPELRTRIVSFGDGLSVIKVIAPEVAIDQLVYRLGPDGTLVMTDGRHFSMDLHEYLPR